MPINHVLIEPGTYGCRNIGDLAMLQVSVARLRKLFPNVSLAAVTRDSNLLRYFCPGVEPVSAASRQAWISESDTKSLRQTQKVQRNPNLASNGFGEHIATADLIVVTGMGGINDAFSGPADSLATVLEWGQTLAKPVALFSQGLGPLTPGPLFDKWKKILSRATLISLRENTFGPSLLDRMGTDRTLYFVTGDDSIELVLATGSAMPTSADKVGFCLRVAPYSGIDFALLQSVGATVCSVARDWRMDVVPVPISLNPGESDLVSYRRVVRHGPLPLWARSEYLSPAEVIKEVSGCQLMITGSYHAAVFALAQGIPVVAISASEYYDFKFKGLMHQFDAAAAGVVLRDPFSVSRLRNTIERLLSARLTGAAALVQSARAQAALGSDAYRRLGDLLTD